MLFSSQLPLQGLMELCHVLHHSLEAGLTLRDVFSSQKKRGPGAVRPVVERISARLDQGDSLEEALAPEIKHFPPLFVAMVGVGEETGNLPTVFGELERYFRYQLQLRRQFRSRILWPVCGFFLAIFVVAGLIWILGHLAERRDQPAQAPVGGPFAGKKGAYWFLGVTVGGLLILAIVSVVAVRTLRNRAGFMRFLLRLPRIGPCLHSLALGRFSLALRLTLDTTLPVHKAVRLSLKATGNAAFSNCAKEVTQPLREGQELAVALARCPHFPVDFLDIVAVGEESGRLPEVMQQRAAYFREESEYRLKALSQTAVFVIYGLYIVVTVIAIFRIAGIYLGALGGR